MAAANIVITDVQITPGTVIAGGKIEICATIHPIRQVIGEDSFKLADSDGGYIEVLGRAAWLLTDEEKLIVDTDGKAIEIYETDL